MSSMFSNTNIVVKGGSFIQNSAEGAQKAFRFLHKNIAAGAFHNSSERYDPPKCHPDTRKAVLKKIMDWIEDFQCLLPILWMYGPAGAGKSAIAQTIADLCEELGYLLATFFFSKSAEAKNNGKYFVPTIAFQMALSIHSTRPFIEQAIERDPSIFDRSLEVQVKYLIGQPIQKAFIAATPEERSTWPRVIIVDGLDECKDEDVQRHILHVLCALVQNQSFPFAILIASRAEHQIRAAFRSGELYRSSESLALDNEYCPSSDIRAFLLSEFDVIRRNHRFKSSIPADWPSEVDITTLVKKSSGQFIYAATVVKYVRSACHLPAERLNRICGISTYQNNKDTPFAELDALYNHIFSSLTDVSTALRIISYKLTCVRLSEQLRDFAFTRSPTPNHSFFEYVLFLQEGAMYCLADLSSVVIEVDEATGDIHFLHASLPDYFLDPSRSGKFHIDLGTSNADSAICHLKHLRQYRESAFHHN
ncbi:hypothetical protein B0H34DRAFT_706406 [Crassisporium funariophilum]|nr:hypothetical protein B0H34DRAFT_706406 [Crassisporium funariophilum]